MRYNQKYVNFLLDGSEYYDFELATESTSMYGASSYDDDAVIDINLCSGLTSSIRWTGATIDTFNLEYITTTGLDNYFVSVPHAYSGGTINTGITVSFTDNDYFTLYPVSGWSTNLSYQIIPASGCTAKLNGGFYQGFFKLFHYPYQMMPSRMRKGWTVDMIVKYPSGKTGTGTTLNDVFPNNAGFIFYMGTRGEDKYWNGFTTGTPSETSVLFNWSGLTITDPRYMKFYYPTSSAGEGGVGIYYYNPSMTAGVSDFLQYEEYKDQGIGYGEDPPPDDYLFYQARGDSYGQYPGWDIGYAYGGGSVQSASLDPLYPDVNLGNVYGGFAYGFAYGDGTETQVYQSTLGYSPLFTHGDEFITGVTSGGTITGYTTGRTTYESLSYSGYYHYTNHRPYAGRFFNENNIPLYVKYPWKNITDNAFGIRIRPDGHIGYRVLRIGNICQTGLTITMANGITGTTTPTYKWEEAYSPFPIWNAGNTGYVNITIVFERYIELNECEARYNQYRKGTLTIYVNARPVFVQDNFEEIIPHALDRQKELQNGVPFNISWGGGTQGLLESVTFGGIDAPDRNLMLQTLFAGTWMGTLHSFKMYIRPLLVPQVIHNFELRKAQYGMQGDFGGRYIFITRG
jgi:hypothetical protein